MTVSSMDNTKNHRRSSWDSTKTSISTVNTGGHRRYRKSASSIISSDSDIRFTRKKLTSQTKCGCCIIATFLLFLLLAAASVYIGYTYFLPEYPGDQIYKATFRVIEGDAFSVDLADPNTNKFKSTSRDYSERLNLLFTRSAIKHGYRGIQVLALDGTEDKDLIIHFDIKIDPSYVDINAKDLEAILANEISVEESLFFRNLTIDAKSLEVKPGDDLPQMISSTLPNIVPESVVTFPPHIPRRCATLNLKYCDKLGYNITTYPNIFGHRNAKEVSENVIAFRELIDAECYHHAYEFVCELLQPGCKHDDDGDNKEDEIILPCRSFCREFLAGCEGRLSENVKTLIDCTKFPEFSSGKKCFTKPGCVDDLKAKAFSPRICDGVIDCADLSDEKFCTYCASHEIHCGIGRTCIQKYQQCDGREDCPDGGDERGCLSLKERIKENTHKISPHTIEYSNNGFVSFNEKGQVGKLCVESLNRTLSENKTAEVLNTVAVSLCKSLNYQDTISYEVTKDLEDDISYVRIKDPFADDLNFVKAKCPTKQVLRVQCDNLDCGLQSTHSKTTRVLQKMSVHGDWPWHVTLFKEEVHICDGILVSSHWIATTTSCFQGQPKAEWTARFGVVRLTSSSPWEQERRIIGMVKSPVEGSTIALVRLDQPIFLNDFVRPVCLPQQNNLPLLTSAMHCTTLGWAKNREQLQRVQVKIIEMQKCENVSITSVNNICSETMHGQNDCNEEEFAGSSMVCKSPTSERWFLLGITNWRIACAKNGMERPRLYDKISTNIDWIRETINNSNNT